jgi:hypothetical protein
MGTQLHRAFFGSLLAGLALPVVAQDGPEANFDFQTYGPPEGASIIATAHEAYAIGLHHGYALAVLAAAEALAAVEVTAGDPVKKTVTGPSPAEDAAGAADAPPGEAEMRRQATELANGDPEHLARIAAAGAIAARERLGGVILWTSDLAAGQSDVWELPFIGVAPSEVAVVGDGDAPLYVHIADENGNTVCAGAGASNSFHCRFVPLQDGTFVVSVTNMGQARNSYHLMREDCYNCGQMRDDCADCDR